ncbi:MAG: hypothetical protein ACRCSG_05165 [Cellulosilyticaceae bacterium]
MIFDELIFKGNREQEKVIDKMEAQLIQIFANYKYAWNAFCKEIIRGDEGPILKKSIEKNRIEESLAECLEEIDNATQELDSIIKNAIEKLELKKLAGKKDYGLVKLQTKTVNNIIKYSVFTGSLITGVALACLFIVKMLDVVNKDSAVCIGSTIMNKSIVGLGILLGLVIIQIVDGVISCIIAAAQKEILARRIDQMNNILGELTRTMVKETDNLTKVTQSIKDGVIWVDKESMYIIDEETSEAQLVTVMQL